MKKLLLFMTWLVAIGIANAQQLYESTGNNVNVRTGPGTNYPVMAKAGTRSTKAQLFVGDRVTYSGVMKNGFMQVKNYDGKWKSNTGWVFADYLRPVGKGQPALTALERKVVGRHMLSLQWISWDYFGTCEITKTQDGRYRCLGEQLSKEHPGDYLKLDGYIEIVNEKHLIFEGDIAIKIYHLNEGEEYVRSGRYDFKSTQNRKYWRAQNLEVIDATDYVDIFFK